MWSGSHFLNHDAKTKIRLLQLNLKNESVKLVLK